jgi:hypothetical protein
MKRKLKFSISKNGNHIVVTESIIDDGLCISKKIGCIEIDTEEQTAEQLLAKAQNFDWEFHSPRIGEDGSTWHELTRGEKIEESVPTQTAADLLHN